MKYPVGGELFAHLASAGFFNEEVPSCEKQNALLFGLFVSFGLAYAFLRVLS